MNTQQKQQHHQTAFRLSQAVAIGLALLMFPGAAFARWVSPSARPSFSATLQTHKVSEPGLGAFHNHHSGASLTLGGVELVLPVTDNWSIHSRYQKAGSEGHIYHSGNHNRLAIQELTLGVSYGYELTSWLLPRVQIDAGATSTKATLAYNQTEYSDAQFKPTAGAKVGVEFRTPGLTWSGSAAHRWFRQFSLSLLVSYGFQWRPEVNLNSAIPDKEFEGTVVGADLGSLGLTGHGVDIRIDLRF